MNYNMKQRLHKSSREFADVCWISGIGIMLILLFVFYVSVKWKPENAKTDIVVYGSLNLTVYMAVYLITVRRINMVLYQLDDMIEGLIGGQERVVFPIAEDTVLSKLQEQVLKLYDILRSYEEKEQQLRKQLNENIGNLVHQMNTPITNIRLYAGFMKRQDLTFREQSDFLHCMEQQAEKLVWLGENFSKVSRLETGMIHLHPQKQLLLPVILEAVNQVMEKAQHKNMDLSLSGLVQSEVMIDAKWTAEAVFNVLDNAVKYGDSGSKIEIEVIKLVHYTAIAVRGKGCKIEKEEYHKIFQRFYRGKQVDNMEGVGLGLFITRQIIEMEGGYIQVKDTYDGKTEFTIYL